jgi:hypothetical protein
MNAKQIENVESYVNQRATQPGIAANRFAREIGGFLNVVGGALAAAANARGVGERAINTDLARSRDKLPVHYHFSAISLSRV